MPTLIASLQSSIVATANRFWRWWQDELLQLLPMRLRSRLQHRQLLPVVVYGEKQWEFWKPVLENKQVARVKQRTLTMTGDPEVQALRARTTIARLASPLALCLPASMILRRTLVLPAALEENLKQALAYDLDRHTPFRGDELYFDAQIIGRNKERNEIQVLLAAAQRLHADRIMTQLRGLGAEIVALLADPPTDVESKLDLLPTEDRPVWLPWQRWAIVAGAALVALLLIATIAVPVWQKRAYAMKLHEQADTARAQAMEVEKRRSELDRLVADYDFVLGHKEEYPSTVHILNEVTKVLPDDTWLTQMELKNTVGSKETIREVFLRGESEHASRLVTALEESGLMIQAAPRSPITTIRGNNGNDGEMFDIGAKIKRLPTLAREAAVVAPPVAVTPPVTPPAVTPPAATPPAAPPAAAPNSPPALPITPLPAPAKPAPAQPPTTPAQYAPRAVPVPTGPVPAPPAASPTSAAPASVAPAKAASAPSAAAQRPGQAAATANDVEEAEENSAADDTGDKEE